MVLLFILFIDFKKEFGELIIIFYNNLNYFIVGFAGGALAYQANKSWLLLKFNNL